MFLRLRRATIPSASIIYYLRHLCRDAAQMTEDGNADNGGENEEVKGRGLCEGGLEEEGQRGVPGTAHERLPPGSPARQGHGGNADNR